MIKDFFIHSCIVVTFLFIGGTLFKNKPIIDTTAQKLKLGVLAGVLGSLLMIFSIQITSTIIIDLRHLAIMLAAMYGSVISVMASVIIISLNRFLFFNGDIESFTVSGIIMLTIGVFSIFVKKQMWASDFVRWTVMGVINLLSITLGFLYLLGLSAQFYQVLLNYWTITIILGTVVFFLAQYIVESNTMFNELKMQSKTDFLTGLQNVRQFDLALNNCITNAQQYNQGLSMLLIDIDHFKKVNDNFGHQAGDEVLKQLAAILMKYSRSTDFVFRNGGEEFAVLLTNCSNTKAVELADRIRLIVETRRFILSDGQDLKVTISIGVSTYIDKTSCPEEFIKNADDNLYKAKRTGRNKVCFQI